MADGFYHLSYKGLIRGLGFIVGIVLFGVLGYMILEGWSLLDALYMTVITITTVGYGEVRELSNGGRVFTVILIFLGIGIMAYFLGIVAQAMVEFQVRAIIGRRKLGLRIKSIKNHYVICGYGRIGRIISQELKSQKIPLLVVDRDSESRPLLESDDIPYIIDDATNEEVLLEAGIKRAKGLVAVVSSDADNVFITLTARGMNPNLFIVSRAEEERAQRKLLRAGADRVVLPYLIGGQKMAQTIIRPAVTDFLEFTVHDKDIELKLEELRVEKDSRLNGVALVDSGIRQQMNIIIVAIRKADGEMLFNPSSQTRMEAGDTLIALGHGNELERLGEILRGG